MSLHLLTRSDAARRERPFTFDWSPDPLWVGHTTIRAELPAPRAEGQIEKRWRGHLRTSHQPA